ncbi:unnamed protein product [Oreochromis niloticus]|nr:unnamed protein product [Mustela putorius furo]
MATSNDKRMTGDKTALSKQDNYTIRALISLLNNLFYSFSSWQWQELILGYPDRFTAKRLVDFVESIMDLCQQSVTVPLRSSQNSPVHTITGETVLFSHVKYVDDSAEQEFDTAQNIDANTQETANTEESCHNADQHSAAKAENNPIPDPQQQKSCVEHEASNPPLTNISQTDSCQKIQNHRSSVACEPPENFERWLSTLIQDVFSKFGKFLNCHPSHSHQKLLLDLILDKIQGMDLHLDRKVQKYFHSIANAIFKDLCEKLCVHGEEDSMNLKELMDLERPIFNMITTSVFQEHLLALTDIDRLESYEKKERCRFSVEIFVEELVSQVAKNSGIVFSMESAEAISKRLNVKIWSEIRAEYDKIPPEKFKKLSKRVFKSLCKRWKHAAAIVTFWQLNSQELDEDIVNTFKRKISKEPSCISKCFSSVRAFFGRFKGRNKVSPL